jgi:tetratricopeptide (TPR) repeat protein
LYEQLGQAERGLLHAEVAAALEKLYAGSPEEICVQLAWHFEQAGDESKAAEYSLQAGRRALSQGAPREAARFFERALEWLPEEDLEGRWRVTLEHNTVLVYLSDLEAWKANIQKLHALARASGDSARVAEVFNREANLALSGGEYGAGLLAADQAVAAARLAGDTVQEALGHHWKVLLYTYLGQFVSGRQAGELALALARASGDETAVMRTLRSVGQLEIWAGYPARALSSKAQSLEIAQRLGDRRMEQTLLLGRNLCYVRMGLPKEARASFEQGLEVARRIGLVAAFANNKALLGDLELLEGNLGAAKLAFSESYAELVKLRQPFGMAHMLMLLGTATERLGEISEAAGHFAEALKGFQQIGGNPKLEMQCRAGIARCALALGQTDVAQQQAAAGWQEVMAHDQQSFAIPAQVYLACADVFAQAGDQETAKIALEIGYRELIDQAYQIDNPEWRKSFLENIPEHRELLTRWGNRQHRDDLG